MPSRAAEALFGEIGEPIPLALCLVRLSRHLFMTGATDKAEAAAQRAVVTLIGVGDDAALAYATLYLGAILAQTRPEEATEVLERADVLALAAQRADLVALCLNYLAIVRVEAGEPDGLQTMRNSIGLAQAGSHHEATARGYCNLAELLLRMGRLDELERCVTEGLTFTRERGFWSHAYNLEVHRCLLLLRRGDWDGAERGLRALLDANPDPGMLFAYSAPWLGRLLARRGDDAAGPLLAEAWEQAQRQRLVLGLAYAGIARAEWAWLTGDLDAARQVAAVLLPRTEHPGAAPFRGELLRYLARAGLPTEPFEGCPPGYDAGLRGDWRPRPRPGGARATRTRPRSSSQAATPRRAPRRSASWSASAPPCPLTASATVCASSASRSRAARARPRGPTRRA